MKFCPHCGEKRGFEEDICSKCGFDYREKNVTGGSTPVVTPRDMGASEEAFKIARREKRKTYLAGFFAVFVTSLIASYTIPGGKNLLFLVGMIGFFSFWNILRVQLSNQEYYALPGTRDSQGTHRCVFCGHHGIYRKGEYQTNNVDCRCSQCGNVLFKE